ncbi:aspartate--tRNA ligase [Arthrobacter sp. Hiyo4]|nr:aspartate--tRNA ligase [Arthrobacter sp. Hiyo4]
MDLRDASGVAQVVVREEEVFHGLRNEYVLQITGTVSERPEGNENPALATGAIEVMADKVVILNTSDPLPFQIDEHVEVGEEARLKHRYLDLRRPGPPATSGCAPKPTGLPVNCSTRTALSRSRPPR